MDLRCGGERKEQKSRHIIGAGIAAASFRWHIQGNPLAKRLVALLAGGAGAVFTGAEVGADASLGLGAVAARTGIFVDPAPAVDISLGRDP